MKTVSLFSGAGGLDLGFILAGHKIVWANDFDHDCCETYKRNIGSHIVEGDICQIDASSIPDVDVVIGGFPCQGFSLANLKRSPHDERNNLYLQFLRIVKEKKPSYFLAENVKGILSLDEGKMVKKIMSDFKSIGYRVKYKLLNAADYGIPETRQRVIFVGTRNDLPMGADYEFPKPTHGNLKKIEGTSLKPWMSVSQALMDIPEPTGRLSDLPNHDYSRYKITVRNFTGHRKTDPKKPSPTILARGNGKGGVCAIPHPRNHRRMSVRESAIIQTFPKDFAFVGSLMSCYRQVGNAVPVTFAKILGEQLKKLENIIILCE